MSECDACSSEQPLVYLVVWPDGEMDWRCDKCFAFEIHRIARHAEAAYYLPDCARVELTIH